MTSPGATRRIGAALGAFAATAVMLASGVTDVTAAIMLHFEGHGAFFSSETHQPVTIDPQIFVQAPGAPGALGPQGILHAAGVVPAPLSAPPDTPLYNADGNLLGTTLGRWLGAAGTGIVEPAGDLVHADRVSVTFTGLVPGGLYTLFKVTFQPSGNTFAPLDGSGVRHNFVALTDGTARATVLTPAPLTDSNAVVLVYHSDGRTHAMSRGTPGVTAHPQLIARVR
ncbi:MAG TPA: hypothetical protein VJT33_13040 [bacterium]|nr:hypothetical protein [bacterium]